MNVSSVKNLNGEVFSAVQDTSLTNVVQTNSGNWQDITAYQNASASYLSAHQDLSDYQTTAGMTAYQPVGDYATTADLALKQDTLTFDYDEQNRISAINNSAIAAGDEFPVSADEAVQYVQTNSAGIDETVNNVTTNSASWGSAGITGVSHDNTLSGTGTVASPLGVVPGYNETVLWSGSMVVTNRTNSATLSESVYKFERIRIYDDWLDNQPTKCTEFDPQSHLMNRFGTFHAAIDSYNFDSNPSFYLGANFYSLSDNGSTLRTERNFIFGVRNSNGVSSTERNASRIYKVVGINRTPLVSNTYTAEYVGSAPPFIGDSQTEYSIKLQPNTYNIQYSAHFVLALADRYKCHIGLYKSTEPNEYEDVYSASYSAVSEDTKIVDISGTLEVDTSIGYDRFFSLRDSSNIFGNVSATITAQCYV